MNQRIDLLAAAQTALTAAWRTESGSAATVVTLTRVGPGIQMKLTAPSVYAPAHALETLYTSSTLRRLSQQPSMGVTTTTYAAMNLGDILSNCNQALSKENQLDSTALLGKGIG